MYLVQVEEFLNCVPGPRSYKAARPLAYERAYLVEESLFRNVHPVQVRRVICLQFNDISMFNSALEKLEHLQKQHITHEFGTCPAKIFS